MPWGPGAAWGEEEPGKAGVEGHSHQPLWLVVVERETPEPLLDPETRRGTSEASPGWEEARGGRSWLFPPCTAVNGESKPLSFSSYSKPHRRLGPQEDWGFSLPASRPLVLQPQAPPRCSPILVSSPVPASTWRQYQMAPAEDWCPPLLPIFRCQSQTPGSFTCASVSHINQGPFD